MNITKPTDQQINQLNKLIKDKRLFRMWSEYNKGEIFTQTLFYNTDNSGQMVQNSQQTFEQLSESDKQGYYNQFCWELVL